MRENSGEKAESQSLRSKLNSSTTNKIAVMITRIQHIDHLADNKKTENFG